MRKTRFLFSTTLALALTSALAGQSDERLDRSAAEKFSLKISAGWGRAGFGDLNRAERGHNDRFRDLANLWGFDQSGALALPHGGPDIGLEILLRLAPRLEVGFGGGLLSRMSRTSEVAMRQDSSGASSLQRWTASASVTPLTLNVYYRVPVSPRFDALLKAGLGCYFATLKLRSFRSSELLGVQTWSQTSGRWRDYALGYQAGLAVEYGLTRALSLFAEGAWRFVNFRNWALEYVYSSASETDAPRTAACWSAEQLNSDTGEIYSVIVYSDQEPAGSGYQSVRKVRVDFSGWSIQAGFRLRLGRR